MSKVKFSFSELAKTHDDIEKFLQELDRKMKNGDQYVKDMGNAWSGEDYLAFYGKWEEILNSQDSAYGALVTELRQYSEKLKQALKKYDAFQQQAIARAKRL